PISRAMWKLIILDHYVNFEKLYATLEKGYDYQDKPKDFGSGFSLVKKDQATAKHAVCTESDWSRTFNAWLAGVLIFYPHQEEELRSYRNRIIDFCHSIPNGAQVAIRFNADTRDCYARNPFWLDEDNKLHIPFLAQLFTLFTPGTKRS
ncbi:hypothetical protein C0995_007748, partial [Termitomyces sp. Mi166